jgi:hypothetical protein
MKEGWEAMDKIEALRKSQCLCLCSSETEKESFSSIISNKLFTSAALWTCKLYRKLPYNEADDDLHHNKQEKENKQENL